MSEREPWCGSLRVAPTVSRWEALIERLLPYERWEWRIGGGEWARYWRRDGSLPKHANSQPGPPGRGAE